VVTDRVCVDPDAGTTVDVQRFTIDLDAGETVSCVVQVEPAPPAPLPNQMNITLDSVPNDPADVSFTLDDIHTFTLDDDADGTLTNGKEFNDMDLGAWALVATLPSGWRIKDIACTDPDGGSTLDKAAASATLDLDNGETVSCTFTIEPIPQTPPPAPQPTCNGLPATIVGKPGATSIRGTAGNDVIVDLDGANRIDGRGGNDTICTGSGNDVVSGGAGDDWIDANEGDNAVSGGGGDDYIAAGAGNDRIDGGKNFDTYLPGGGSDVVRNCEA
jgi:Ca2+-binding RTX toxin-like protein